MASFSVAASPGYATQTYSADADGDAYPAAVALFTQYMIPLFAAQSLGGVAAQNKASKAGDYMRVTYADGTKVDFTINPSTVSIPIAFSKKGEFFTFAMLTFGADQHPLMKRMHKPGEEKRLVVILDRNEYLPWLTCSLVDARLYFKPWVGPLLGEAAPLARAPTGTAGWRGRVSRWSTCLGSRQTQCSIMARRKAHRRRRCSIRGGCERLRRAVCPFDGRSRAGRAPPDLAPMFVVAHTTDGTPPILALHTQGVLRGRLRPCPARSHPRVVTNDAETGL